MKYHKDWPALVALSLSVLLLGFYGNSQAAGPLPGQGPGDALPAPDGWQTLAPGGQTWYAFTYVGDKSEILVRLSAAPAGSAAFAIWSPTDVDRWGHGYAASPTGRGSANAAYGGDLVWAGSSSQPGTWYVVVTAPGSAQTWFNLTVAGQGVTRHAAAAPTPLPTAAAPSSTPAALARPFAAPPALAPEATPVAADRFGLAFYHPRTPTPVPAAQYPADALPLSDGPQTLGVGAHVWYAFQYAGDRSRILMQLHADPPGSATFTVWSWDVLQRWAENYFYTPTGRGTANDVYGGDLVWFGGSIIRGKWYVVVEQNGPRPATYTLQVSGTGVDRSLPPTPVSTPTRVSLIP